MTTRKAKRRVAITNPELELTIVAKISAEHLDTLEESLAEALDELRQYGSADVIKRRVTAEVLDD